MDKKLILNPQQEMVNNNGYLEPAANGQFDDAERNDDDDDDGSNENEDQNKMKGDGDGDDKARDAVDVNKIIFSRDSAQKEFRQDSASGLAEHIFDNDYEVRYSQSQSIMNQGNVNNPYLDPGLMKGFDRFAPKQNRSFEKKFESYKELDDLDGDQSTEQVMGTDLNKNDDK